MILNLFLSINLITQYADWNGLSSALVDYDWNYMFSHCFKDELWDVFYSVIFDLITEFVPTKMYAFVRVVVSNIPSISRNY